MRLRDGHGVRVACTTVTSQPYLGSSKVPHAPGLQLRAMPRYHTTRKRHNGFNTSTGSQ